MISRFLPSVRSLEIEEQFGGNYEFGSDVTVGCPGEDF